MFVPTVTVVPAFIAFAALMPPLVRIAPVVLLVASSVDGANMDALAPVPPIVRSVVAPAKAVKEASAQSSDVVIVGEVPNTSAPLPVSSVTAAARFAELGVVRKVAMPVPKSELRTSVTAVPVPFLKDGTPLPSEYQAERPAISVGAVPF